MKLFVGVVGVVLAVLCVATSVHGDAPTPKGAPLLQKLQADIAACNTTEKPPADDIIAYLTYQMPVTKEGKCFVGCVMEKRGTLVNGAYSLESAVKMAKIHFAALPDALKMVLEIHAKCEPEVGGSTDKCVSGPKVLACMLKNINVVDM